MAAKQRQVRQRKSLGRGRTNRADTSVQGPFATIYVGPNDSALAATKSLRGLPSKSNFWYMSCGPERRLHMLWSVREGSLLGSTDKEKKSSITNPSARSGQRCGLQATIRNLSSKSSADFKRLACPRVAISTPRWSPCSTDPNETHS